MPGWTSLHLARHTVQPFTQQRAQRPASAIAAEHVQVVDVDVRTAMCLANFWRVNVVEPVVGDHFARYVEDEPTQRVPLIGVGINAPIGLLQVLVHRCFHIH